EDGARDRRRGDAEGQRTEEVRHVHVGRRVEAPRQPGRRRARPADVARDRVVEVREDRARAALVDEIAEGPGEGLDGEPHQPEAEGGDGGMREHLAATCAAFFARTEPASSSKKPLCMKKMMAKVTPHQQMATTWERRANCSWETGGGAAARSEMYAIVRVPPSVTLPVWKRCVIRRRRRGCRVRIRTWLPRSTAWPRLRSTCSRCSKCAGRASPRGPR